MKSNSISAKHKSIMLIDDNEIDNFIAEKLIKSYRFADNVFVHTSSKSALEFLKNIEATLKDVPADLIPSHIFLDVNMPLLDGYHFLDEFKNLSTELTDKIKIVMLSSSRDPLEIGKCKNYKSVVKFISKPLTEEALADL